MEAKAPEKIYVTINHPVSEEYTEIIAFENGNGIEYTRTDAFIKKAVEWLKENKDHPFIGCEDPCLSGYLTDEFIEDFKNYMEG